MSGGSYEYLYRWDVEELMTLSGQEQIERMRDRLRSLNVIDAAGETDALLSTIREAQQLIEMRANRLRELWHDIEWIDSGDYGDDRLPESVAEYRKQATP